MAVEALAWPAEPTLTDGDDGENYTLGALIYVLAAQPCEGVRWRVPDTVVVPTVTGVHAISLWNADTEARLAYKTFVPTPGVYQDILFDAPFELTPGTNYVVAAHTRHYVFRAPSPPAGWQVITPSGNCFHESSRLATTGDPNAYPNGTFNAWYYVSPLMTVGGPDPQPSPAGVAMPVALGTPGVEGASAPQPGGVALPVGLGSPGVNGASTPQPAGLALPIALGTPRVPAPVVPAGLGIPVALGSPAVGLGLAPSPTGLAIPIGLGTPAVADVVSPDGVALPISLGTPATSLTAVQPPGVAVPLVLGIPGVGPAAAPQPPGVPLPIALGTPEVGPPVPVTALPVLSGTAAVRPGPSGTATVATLSGTATIT